MSSDRKLPLSAPPALGLGSGTEPVKGEKLFSTKLKPSAASYEPLHVKIARAAVAKQTAKKAGKRKRRTHKRSRKTRR
jgi:hypothetical protein